VQFGQFDARARTQGGVEVGQRLVEQKGLGLLDDRVQAPFFFEERTQASTKATPSSPSRTVGKHDLLASTLPPLPVAHARGWRGRPRHRCWRSLPDSLPDGRAARG
jgi:hypothetical protein